jgi:hypothetical protein
MLPLFAYRTLRLLVVCLLFAAAASATPTSDVGYKRVGSLY